MNEFLSILSILLVLLFIGGACYVSFILPGKTKKAKDKKEKENFNALVKQDKRLGNVRIFDKAIESPIAVSEDGHLGIYQKASIKSTGFLKFENIPESLTILHISSVNGVELLVKKKSGLVEAVAGGLIFGDGGAVVGQAIASKKTKRIDLQIKTKDFHNPQVVVPLYQEDPNKVFNSVNNLIEQEIQELMSLLESLIASSRQAVQAPVTIQQSSDADELAKFKKLLDDGVITQDDFNAKKKALLGL